MRSFDYSIIVEPLARPMGRIRYVAKLAYFYESTESGEQTIDPGLGESWGPTEAEARTKLHDKIDAWIAAHSLPPPTF